MRVIAFMHDNRLFVRCASNGNFTAVDLPDIYDCPLQADGNPALDAIHKIDLNEMSDEERKSLLHEVRLWNNIAHYILQ